MRYRLDCFGKFHTFIAFSNPRGACRVFAYGPTFSWAESDWSGSHRARYAPADAQAVCDWLNDRAAGYPVPEGVP